MIIFHLASEDLAHIYTELTQATNEATAILMALLMTNIDDKCKC